MQEQSELEAKISHLLATLDEPSHESGDEGPALIHVYPLPNGTILLSKTELPPPPHNIVESSPTVTPRPNYPFYVTACLSALLLLFLVASALVLTFFPPITTVTLMSKVQRITTGAPLRIVPGTPGPGEIPGNILPAITLSQSVIEAATGFRHQDATAASGHVTFFNGEFNSLTLPAGTLLTGSDGVAVATTQALTIPAANPPSFGQASVWAYAIKAGSQGNIPAYAINQPCCASSVLAQNTQAFGGGRNERNYQVVQQQDIDGAVPTLKGTLDHILSGALGAEVKAQETLVPFPCSTRTTADHQAGDEAQRIRVTVSETCGGMAYDPQQLQAREMQLLSNEATARLGSEFVPVGTMLTSRMHIVFSHTALTLQVSVSRTYAYMPDKQSQDHMKHLVAGKNTRQATALLLSQPGIAQVAISGQGANLPNDTAYIHFTVAIPATGTQPL